MGNSHARARSVESMREAGRKAAAVLRAGGYQIEAAVAAGVSEKTYYRWLEADEDDELAMAFQAEVVPALVEQAKAAEKRAERDIFGADDDVGGTTDAKDHSGPAVNWWKWKLATRYRKFFGDLAQKVEHSGSVTLKHDLSRMSEDELESELGKSE